MNISPQECHTVQNILDTHVILDRRVKEEIVIQEEESSTNMTDNINVEEARVQKIINL